ncbi:DUF1273 domain-containing protein [Vagococcus xieshaowenii]|uniref:UPF0398 protein E4031_07465 n=1 Tax=Vagococcus xieshaowenii TaxID=2562451 RepID=A0AAJ5EE45_9ENTE|nr:DUF1273 domain-containing protein [Vagococcus xieshaowenii]QCA28574.1 DUF1273 domain-containing protein [Vagococcus xieshaowenii]TFZ40618.1 DUF1273 domain-containing protein [Vagococcus xieshaowenii]
MRNMKTLYISGYRSFELGIFKETDPKITIIKKALKKHLISYIELGVEWFLVSGNLGSEYWASQVINELKSEGYSIKLGLITPYAEFSGNWNEANQLKFSEVEQWADYVNSVSFEPYKHPSQLKNHTRFILDHTDGSLLVYDKEYPGKTEFILKEIDAYLNESDYQVDLIDMFSLQDASESE